MRFVSWNVNGLRACMQKGFMDFFNTVNADFFCLQETKLQEGQIQMELPGYEQYWCYAEKKGYSGTAIFTKHTPLSVAYGMGIAELDTEGRLITLEYPEFYLVTCYTPNAQRGLARIEHRLNWEAAFRDYLSGLDSKKPVILCGDLNVAHKEIDLKNPASNRGNAGFSDEERDAFTKLLECGFTDSFRHLHPDTTGAYTWWSYMFNARQNNAGWRIDYFVVSDRIKEQIFSTPIYSEIMGSDHCPVGLDMDIPCNGSIWSSFENTEAARKAEEEPEKKSSGVKAAAALLCAAILLTGIYFSIPRNDPQPPATEAPATTTPVIRPPGDDLICWTVGNKELGYTFANAPIYSSTILINSFQDGLKTYPIDTAPLASDLKFWVRIDAIDPVEMIGCDLYATVVDKSHAEDSHPNSIAYTSVVKYRDERGIFAGWFVYGYIQRDAYVTIELRDDIGVLQKATIPVSPIFTAEDAETMTTEQLVDYAVHLDILEMLHNNNLAQPKESFLFMWRHYPALAELTFRFDAVWTLKQHAQNYPACSDKATVLQDLIDMIWDDVAPYRDFSDCIFTAYTTQELIDILIRQPALETFLSQYMELLEDHQNVYQLLRQIQPAVAELEKRDDAIEALLKHYDESPVINFLFSQPEFLSKLSVFEATELISKLQAGDGIETVSTENLVTVITSVFHVNSTLQLSYPYNYDQLRQAFPPLQELEKREDAHTVLITYLIDYRSSIQDDQKSTASLLLYQEPFHSRLEDWQLEILDRGGLIVYGDAIIGPPVQSPDAP